MSLAFQLKYSFLSQLISNRKENNLLYFYYYTVDSFSPKMFARRIQFSLENERPEIITRKLFFISKIGQEPTARVRSSLKALTKIILFLFF